jgi:DNA (cytosine-5)-methyltransferase 1
LRVLDLFCGAGGAAMGVKRAWPEAEITGVDINPQPNYPFTFVQADAMTYPLDGFDFIWTSPPCQAFSAYRRKGHGVGEGYPDLIAPVRERLKAAGVPYIIENVPGAPLIDFTVLCGSHFDLDIRRHRHFETSFTVEQPRCAHNTKPRRFVGATNNKHLRRTVEVGVWRIPLAVQQQAMGIDWMTLKELSQAVPPAYSEYL